MADDTSNNQSLKRKRAKISFSCIVCREKRTRCDKNTICSACKNRGSTCQYDTLTQQKPKRPNKDALILRLSKQLEFYKDLACKYTPKDKLSLFSEETHSIDYALGSRTLKKVNIVQKDNAIVHPFTNEDDQYILQLKRNNDNFLYGIFTDMYIFKSDDYVNTLFFKRNKTNSLDTKKDDISFITSLLSNQTFKSEFQKAQSLKFTQALNFENSIMGKKEFYNPFTGFFNTFNFDNVRENTIENVIENEPSDLLRNIIHLLNNTLPSRSFIQKLKKEYFENLYPEFPFLDVDFFEHTLLNVLNFDNERVFLHLGKNDIHNKICMIGLLFSILYLAYLNENNNVDFDNDIIDQYLEIAMKLLLSTDVLCNPTEHKFSLLCQIWVCLTITPQSKFSEDITKRTPTGSLVGVITSVASDLKIGLDSDLDERAERVPSGLGIFRKKLSLAYTIITLIEGILKNGAKENNKFPNLSFNDQTTQLYSTNELENEFFKFAALRNHLYKLIYDVMTMFTKTRSNESNDYVEHVDLSLLRHKITKLFQFVDEAFPFNKMTKVSTGNEMLYFPSSLRTYSVNKALVKNMYTINCWITSRAVISRVYHVVMVSCEHWAFEGFNSTANKWFMYFIIESLKHSMDLLVTIRKIHNKEYKDYLAGVQTLFLEYIVLYSYSKAFVVLLQFVGKCFVFKIYLQRMVLNEGDNSTKLKVEMHLIKEMRDVSSSVLFEALHEYSNLYRFKRYKCFKLCLFFDFFRQIYKDDTLFNTMFETNDRYDPNAPLSDEVCNSYLMRDFLKFYDYLDHLKTMTEYFRTDSIQDYLKTNTPKARKPNRDHDFTPKKQISQMIHHVPSPLGMEQRPTSSMNSNVRLVPNVTPNGYPAGFDPNFLPLYSNQLSLGPSRNVYMSTYNPNIVNPQMMSSLPNSHGNNTTNTLLGREGNASIETNTSGTHGSSASGESETVDDDFTFENYLRQLDLQKFDVFGSSFLF